MNKILPGSMGSALLEALPDLAAPGTRERAVLDASRAVVGVLLAAGHFDLPVRRLAERAGLSERTFYRYFPTKEDAIRPYVRAGLDRVIQNLEASPAEIPLREALVAAHGELLDLAAQHDGARFLAVIDGDPSLRAVWLAVGAEAERGFAAAVGARLGVPATSPRARMAAAVIAAAGRLALEAGASGGRPSEVFAAALDAVGPGLLECP